jgi:hypothetical protein
MSRRPGVFSLAVFVTFRPVSLIIRLIVSIWILRVRVLMSSVLVFGNFFRRRSISGA